jgi:hypothetical protein
VRPIERATHHGDDKIPWGKIRNFAAHIHDTPEALMPEYKMRLAGRNHWQR